AVKTADDHVPLPAHLRSPHVAKHARTGLQACYEREAGNGMPSRGADDDRGAPGGFRARRRLACGPVDGVFPERKRTRLDPGVRHEKSEIRTVVRVHRLLLEAPTSGVLGFNIPSARPDIVSARANSQYLALLRRAGARIRLNPLFFGLFFDLS